MYKSATKKVFEAVFKEKYNYVMNESDGRSIHNFLSRLEKLTGIELSEKHNKELFVIAEKYFDVELKDSGFNFKMLFDEVTRKRVVNDKLETNFTDVLDDLYKKLQREECIDKNANLINDVIELSEGIFKYFMIILDGETKRFYSLYSDKDLEKIRIENNPKVELALLTLVSDIQSFKVKYKYDLSTNLIIKIFLEHFKRRISKQKEKLEDEINFTKEFESKYNIPNKDSFTLKEIGEIILASGEETDEKKIQSNLRKTFSEMGLSLYYSRKSKVYDAKYQGIEPIKKSSKIPRERVINILIEREVRRRKLKGRAITKSEVELNMDCEIRKVEDSDYYKRVEEFYRRGKAIYARETNRGNLNNSIINYKIKIFNQIETTLSIH